MSDGARFVRPSLEQLPSGEPQPPRPPGVVSLGLNEGISGPFPAALAVIEAAVAGLNRYPERGSHSLVAALAAHHGVDPGEVFVAAGADAVIGYVCQAALDPGDEVVVPWPSFPSFARDPQKRDAVSVLVPLREGSIDFDALRAAVSGQTRLVFIATPNNPTGRACDADELTAFVRGLPDRVLAVVDEAYFDYLDPADRLDAITDLFRAGDDVLALRTFSKLYGLAGLRVGYGIGPPAVVAAMRKVQRGYDVSSLAQLAALASIDDAAEVERRRAANLEAVAALTARLRERGLDPLAGSVANFVLVDVGEPADEVASRLLAAGVAVQSGAPFGAPTSIRVGAGSEAELARLEVALDAAGFSVR